MRVGCIARGWGASDATLGIIVAPLVRYAIAMAAMEYNASRSRGRVRDAARGNVRRSPAILAVALGLARLATWAPSGRRVASI
jgi:hypothetical protein